MTLNTFLFLEKNLKILHSPNTFTKNNNTSLDPMRNDLSQFKKKKVNNDEHYQCKIFTFLTKPLFDRFYLKQA